MLDTTSAPNLLENLKADKTASDSDKSKWDGYRETWISEFNGKPYGNEKKNKSSIYTQIFCVQILTNRELHLITDSAIKF